MSGGPKKRFFRVPGRRGQVPEDVETELDFHLQERVEKLVDQGWSEEAARREAERRFGDRERVREACVEIDRRREQRMRIRGWMGGVAGDLKLAFRGLRRRPGFGAALILTLALGFGATTAIYTVVDSVLLRDLPFRDPDRLVQVQSYQEDGDFMISSQFGKAARAWLADTDFAEEVAGTETLSMVRLDGPVPEQVRVSGVTRDFLETLGVEPVRGRSFLAEDFEAGAPDVILVDHWTWIEDLDGSADVMGRKVRLDQRTYTVIGVLPRAFKFPLMGSAAWGLVPIREDLSLAGEPLDRLDIIARIPSEMSRDVFAERAGAFAQGLVEAGVGNADYPDVRITALDAYRANPDTRRALWFLLAASGLMLLIAVGNTVNLLMVRNTGRRRELGVRRSLGASRGRLLRQFTLESLVYSILGATAAVILARYGVQALLAAAPRELTAFTVNPITMDGGVLLHLFLLAAGTGIVLGLLPAGIAVRTPRSTSSDALGVYADRSPRSGWTRSVLVVTGIAFSVALLLGAGLLTRSFYTMMTEDPGFETEGLVYLEVGLSRDRYPERGDRRSFYERMQERVEALPGVTATALATGTPPGGGGVYVGIGLQAEGKEPPPDGTQPLLLPYVAAQPSFLEVMGMRMRAGRWFGAEDAPGEDVAVVDGAFARYLWGSEEQAVGERFRIDEDGDWYTVVGVLEDVTVFGPDDRQGPYDLFRPLDMDRAAPYWTLAVRTGVEASSLIGPIRSVVHDLDPEQPIRELQTADAALRDASSSERFFFLLSVLLAGVGLVLASVGLYGVLTYTMSRRTREFGIRMALGASVAKVTRSVLGYGMRLTALGLFVGLLGGFFASGLLRSILFDLSPRDPLTFIIAGILMLLVGLSASLLPALRTARLDPSVTLREE